MNKLLSPISALCCLILLSTVAFGGDVKVFYSEGKYNNAAISSYYPFHFENSTFTASADIRATGVALDTLTKQIYWAEGAYANGRIIRASAIDGHNFASRETLVTGASCIFGLALDKTHGLLYYTTTNLATGPAIWSVPIAGGSPTLLKTFTDGKIPRGIAVNPATQLLYFASDATGEIIQYNSTTDTPTILATGQSTPIGVAIDVANGYIYWTESVASGTIKRAVLTTGASPTTIYSGREYPNFITVSTADASLYWTELTASGVTLGTVYSGLASGLGSPTKIIEFLNGPMGIAAAPADPLLAVSLAMFSGARTGGGVKLEWSTMTEEGNLGFYVERRDGEKKPFVKISALIPGAGTTLEEQAYAWSDPNPPAAGCSYRLRQLDQTGGESFSNVITIDGTLDVTESGLPREFRLNAAYPNPFNPSATISFTVERTGFATLNVYSVTGELVTTLFNETADPGKLYSVRFNAEGLASGVYYYRLISAGRAAGGKVMLVR